MRITLNLSHENTKAIKKKSSLNLQQVKTVPINYVNTNKVTLSSFIFPATKISFGQNQFQPDEDNALFNEEDATSFSIKLFNNINKFLSQYKNKTPESESLYLLNQDKKDKAISTKNITIMNNASAKQVNAELVDMFNFASANKIQTNRNTYLFDNSTADEIKAKKIYLSDKAFSSKNEAETVWIKDNATAENITANNVYQRNNSKTNTIFTKNFFAADNINCENLTANNILLKNSANVQNAIIEDGEVVLYNDAKINNLNTQNSKIILNQNTSIQNITSEDNLTITGNGTIGDVVIKGSHLFLNGPIRINGKIRFATPDGVVIAQRGKQNIFPKIDSSMVESGILQFLISDKNNVYLGNPGDVFASGLSILGNNIAEEKNKEQIPVYSKDSTIISEINNNPEIKSLYVDFYKDNLQLLSNDNKAKVFSLFWTKNAKLGEKKLADIWMEILDKQPESIPDTQKTYKINNLTDGERKLLLEKTTLYWFKNILPQIIKEQNFNDFDCYKQNLDTIEKLLDNLEQNKENIPKILSDNKILYEKLNSLQLDNQSLFDFWLKNDNPKFTQDIKTERLKKQHLNELLASKHRRKKIINITQDELKNQKNFIKSYEFACDDLIKNEPELDKLQQKLLEKYKNSKVFYQIISETSNKTNDTKKIEIEIIKILQSLTNEYRQLSIDARKNIFDKTLNVAHVITAKPNTELDNYVNFVFTALSQNVHTMPKEDLFDFINDTNAFKNFVSKNSAYFSDYWLDMVKNAYRFYDTKMLDMITKNNLKLLYSNEQNKKNASNKIVKFINTLQKNSADTIEQKEFISRFKDNINFEKLMNNTGIEQKKALTELLMTEVINENLYLNRLNSYPQSITTDSVKENLDLTDKYLVLIDKDYSDMSIQEKYKTISKVPDEEFRLMNRLIFNDWKKHELQNLLNNKFVLMQLEYNANAQSKNIKDNLETINSNLNNIRINIAGQNYTLQEMAANLDTLVNISQKSFKELYFIGENIEAINSNTQSIKANTRAVLYATMQNSKFRDPELSKTIEELLPVVERGSFSDFLSEVEKKYQKIKDEKKKKELKQIANLAMLAASASCIGYIDPSFITGFLGGGDIITHAISAIKPIADTLKHVAIFKAATTGMK